MFQYFVSIVPTQYIDRHGRSLKTNQYSVTDYARVVDHGQGVPGIFVKYDMEPLTMVVRERATSLLHFLVRLASIVGGVWTCSGYAFRVTNRVGNVVKKAREGRDVDPYDYAASYSSSTSLRSGPGGSDTGGAARRMIPEMIRTTSSKLMNAANNFAPGGGKHKKTESMQQKIWSEEGRPDAW